MIALKKIGHYKHFAERQSKEQIENEKHQNIEEIHNNTQENQDVDGSASSSTPDPTPVSASGELAGFTKVSDTFNNNGLVKILTSSISFVDSIIVSTRVEIQAIFFSTFFSARKKTRVRQC